MRNVLLVFIAAIILSSCQEKITIVKSEKADSVMNFASEELSRYLGLIYPDYTFPVSNKPGKGKSILLKLDESISISLGSNEAYRIISEGRQAVIESGGNTGLVYGVYGILEKLGCGFFLSDEFLPEEKGEFNFDGWNISNSPNIKERYVFNWHNFISGCTGWDKVHWLEWVDRSQKMGYNAVMVHAYHNNPMYTFDFKGETKEVGYINTSGKGRDWGNIPVNDVRRLPGGEIYENAVFGSEIALVPDEDRVKIAQETMSEVFSYALNRGVQVCFAIDIDMPISFMKNTIVKNIPEEERFYAASPDLWIPDPGKPSGYDFYKSQIDGLLKSYPMLERIAIFRRGASFFRDVETDEMPSQWRNEYQDYIKSYSFLSELDQKELICSFITSRIVLCCQKILNDIGRKDIQLSTGSWAHDFVLPTATFLPEEIKLMPIDWDVRIERPMLENPQILADFSNEICRNRVVPFIWAHHDDGHYVGRCYAPTENLNEKLHMAKCESFGVFHWMNRPLDLFFKGMIRQVWENTENETLEETSKIMARNYFGSEEMDKYFIRWINDAPIFGRATLMNFFHRPMNEANYDFEEALEGCGSRIELLKSADQSIMSAKQKEYVKYFETLEEFIIEFSNTQPHLLRAEKYLADNEIANARMELNKGNPEDCIKAFSKLGRIAKEERGEIAFTQRFAVKYLADYLSFKQRAGLSPYMINVDSIVYEDVAQGNFNITYHVDPAGNLLECLGERELHAGTENISELIKLDEKLEKFREIFSYGANLKSDIIIPIRPIMRAPGVQNKDAVYPGQYILKILIGSEFDEELSLTTEINGSLKEHKISGSGILQLNHNQTEVGLIELKLRADNEKVYFCGLILEPVLD